MNFENYLNQAWADHAKDSVKVAGQFETGIQLIETNNQIADMAWLVTHVMGEHLARWNDGIAILENLKSNPSFISGTDTDKAIQRSVAVLKLASHQLNDLSSFGLSDQIRILAMAASALSGSDVSRASELLKEALKLSETGVEKKDPANRSLAVTGNNLASALEEKKSRTAGEVELMILAAQTSRKYWELAGGPKEVSLAEYRLTMSYTQAQMFDESFKHAQNCIEICEENKLSALDLFFGYEALAVAEKNRGNGLGSSKAIEKMKVYFEQLSADDQKWCEATLKKLA